MASKAASLPSWTLARDAASVRGMKSPNPSSRAHHGVRVAGMTGLDAALQVLDDQPRHAGRFIAIDAAEARRRDGQRSQEDPLHPGVSRHGPSWSEDAVASLRP